MKLRAFNKLRWCVQLLCIVIMIMPALNVNAQSKAKPLQKSTFTESDIFKSAVFLENRDIVQPYRGEQVLYYLNHDHVNAYFTEKGVVYKVMGIDTNEAKELKEEREEKREQYEQEKREKKENHEKEDGDEDKGEKTPHILSSIVEMEWIGANPHPQIEVSNKGEGYYTYLKPEGKSFKTLITEGYKSLVYKNIYPGIDAEYSFPDKGGIEYSLIVHPGANPDMVMMLYKGDVVNVQKNSAGDIVVHTNTGDLIEHAPKSFTGTQASVNSGFIVNNNVVQFEMPSGYNLDETLTIDPWITALTTLPPVNIGMKVDYDYLGDLFAYGAGPTSWTDVTEYFEVAKYNTSGTMLWVFSGSVPAVWNSTDGGSLNYPGGFRVDRITGKSYVSQGFCETGTQTIRLTSTGTYDNFISTLNSSFNEAWGIMYNCSTETIMDVGGGTSGSINMGVINTGSGSVTSSNITGIVSTNQDIICAAYDSAGYLYAVMNDDLGVLPFTNTIYKINTTYNGNIWKANSTFTTYVEAENMPFWAGGENGNWSNCLAANGNYLFYYDGFHVAAYNLATGAVVGTPITIAGYTAAMQGGIAVDRCNNMYLGGIGKILVYNFNGATFTHGTDISLGGAYSTDEIEDVTLNTGTNQLYVIGKVVGTFIATATNNCAVPRNFSVSTSHTCNSATVQVTPGTGLSPIQFTYILFDSASNIVSQQTNVTSTTDNFPGLSQETYYVQVQWNANCGGEVVNDTIVIHCSNDSISPPATICQGDSAIISFTGTPAGGTYSWSPGGYTDSVITVRPVVTTTYIATYTPPASTPVVDSVTITVLPLATITVSDTAVCFGDTATLYVTPSQAGGTYLWSPGGATTSSIIVSPAATTTYQVTYTAQCNAPVGTGTVTVQPITLVPHSDTVCEGSVAHISVTPSIGGGTYAWAPGNYTTQVINVTPVSTGMYQYTVTYTHGQCSVTDSAFVLADSIPVVSIANDTICQGSQGALSATVSLTGGTYNWTPGNFTTANISVSPTVTTSYRLSYNVAGCIALDSASVVVDPMPALTMAGDSICVGNPGQVSTTPTVTGGTYLWSPGGLTTATATVTPVVSTTYSVVYTAALCTVSGNATVTVLPLPLVAVTGDTVCSGTPVPLTAVPSKGSGTYAWAPGGGTTPTITVSPTTTTTYTVTYTLAGCGTAVDSAMVKVYQIPTVTTTDTNFCDGNSGQVSATPSIPGGTYLWSPGAGNTPAIMVSPTATTVYTITYSVNGCSVTGNSTVTVHPNPTVSVTGVGATCGEPNGSETAVATGGASPYAYLWSTAATTATITQLAGNETYTVSVLDNFMCSSSGSFNISQSTAVVAAATGVNEKCPGYTDGWAGSTATGGLTPYTYVWSNQALTQNISGLAPGNYIVTVSDITGCTASAQVSILTVADDTFSTAAQPTSCYGPQYQDGSLTITPVTLLRQPYQYSLNGTTYQSSGTFSNLAFGNYNVTVMDDSGCVTTVNNIDVPEAAEATLSVNPSDTTVNLGQSLTLATDFGPYPTSSVVSYVWTPSEYLSCITCPNPIVTPYAPLMTYTVVLTYNNHCVVNASAVVHMNDNPDIFIPNVFTPNGDGNNDIFYVYGNNIKLFNIKIFNRWGEKVFESNDQQTGWDGRYKGVMQDPNVFVYEAYIVLLDNTTFHKTGSVTLVR